MAKIIQRIVVFMLILISDFVISANVNGLEKREDSYIDALHKTHADDALNCEFEFSFSQLFPLISVV